jgi:hypothetical protein
MVGNVMRTNCAPLIVDLFLYHYEYNIMAKLQKTHRVVNLTIIAGT